MVLTHGLARSAPVRRLAAFSFFAMAVLATVILAGANRAVSNADWQVLAVSGDVEWRGAGTTIGGWQDLEANGHVPDGAEIRTGGNGNAVVAKGLDRIEIRPGTELVVAARMSPQGALEIDQTSGSATYTVEKRPAGTFSVHTPYVVAVVKGTKFDVDITNNETSVSVKEGRVGVSDRRSGDSVDVTPGQRATSSRKGPGVDVETAAKSSSKAPGTPNSNASPNAQSKAKADTNGKAQAQSKANANPNANVNSTTRGNSATAPGQTKGNSASASGRGNSGSNGNGGGNGGGSDAGGDSGGGDSGGDSGGGGSGGGDSGADSGSDSGGNSGGKGADNGNAGGNDKGNAGGNGKGKGKDS